MTSEGPIAGPEFSDLTFRPDCPGSWGCLQSGTIARLRQRDQRRSGENLHRGGDGVPAMTHVDLRSIRTALCWPQSRMAVEIGRSLRQYKRYESGKAVPAVVVAALKGLRLPDDVCSLPELFKASSGWRSLLSFLRRSDSNASIRSTNPQSGRGRAG